MSSSGQLLGKGAGPQIDNSSCVIRMNAAPVHGFEKDVGSRTTLRVVCFISSKMLKNDGRTFLMGAERPEMVLYWGLNSSKHGSSLTIAKQTAKAYGDKVQFYSQSLEGEDYAGKVFQKESGFNRLVCWSGMDRTCQNMTALVIFTFMSQGAISFNPNTQHRISQIFFSPAAKIHPNRDPPPPGFEPRTC